MNHVLDKFDEIADGYSEHDYADPERYGSLPSCSARHQSLLTLLPSIWCAAVAAPHKNPLGKAIKQI